VLAQIGQFIEKIPFQLKKLKFKNQPSKLDTWMLLLHVGVLRAFGGTRFKKDLHISTPCKNPIHNEWRLQFRVIENS
jgi:hypothetical protein